MEPRKYSKQVVQNMSGDRLYAVAKELRIQDCSTMDDATLRVHVLACLVEENRFTASVTVVDYRHGRKEFDHLVGMMVTDAVWWLIHDHWYPSHLSISLNGVQVQRDLKQKLEPGDRLEFVD